MYRILKKTWMVAKYDIRMFVCDDVFGRMCVGDELLYRVFENSKTKSRIRATDRKK